MGRSILDVLSINGRGWVNMTDEQKDTGSTAQQPTGHIGEALDIEYWTLLEECRILQAG